MPYHREGDRLHFYAVREEISTRWTLGASAHLLALENPLYSPSYDCHLFWREYL